MSASSFSIKPLLVGEEPCREVGMVIDTTCPLPQEAIVKGSWRIAILQGQLDLEGPNGMQALILAGALFPGPDLVRLTALMPHVEGFAHDDAKAPVLIPLVDFADARWRLARRGHSAWLLMHIGRDYTQTLSDYPIPGSHT